MAGAATVWLKRAPGISLAVVVAVVAWMLGTWYPVIGGPVFAIILGGILANIWGAPKSCEPGLAFTGKKVLQWAVILLGTGLNIRQIWQVGQESLAVLVFTLAAAFITAYFVGRVLRVNPNLTALIGVGTGICGGSAIAAIAPIIEADDSEVAYSISTIFLFNVAAVFIFPAVGHLLQMTPLAFGLWAGTAINDTSSVVAAAYSYGNEAGLYATVVKLTRTTMIIPVAFGLALYLVGSRMRLAEGEVAGVTEGTANDVPRYKVALQHVRRVFPWFIAWFLVAAVLRSVGVIPTSVADILQVAAKFMIVVALAAIGFGARTSKLMQAGYRPLLLGLIVWFAVAIVGLFVQGVVGHW